MKNNNFNTPYIVLVALLFVSFTPSSYASTFSTAQTSNEDTASAHQEMDAERGEAYQVIHLNDDKKKKKAAKSNPPNLNKSDGYKGKSVKKIKGRRTDRAKSPHSKSKKRNAHNL